MCGTGLTGIKGKALHSIPNKPLLVRAFQIMSHKVLNRVDKLNKKKYIKFMNNDDYIYNAYTINRDSIFGIKGENAHKSGIKRPGKDEKDRVKHENAKGSTNSD